MSDLEVKVTDLEKFYIKVFCLFKFLEQSNLGELCCPVTALIDLHIYHALSTYRIRP